MIAHSTTAIVSLVHIPKQCSLLNQMDLQQAARDREIAHLLPWEIERAAILSQSRPYQTSSDRPRQINQVRKQFQAEINLG